VKKRETVMTEEMYPKKGKRKAGRVIKRRCSNPVVKNQIKGPRRRWFKRKLIWIPGTIAIVLIAYLTCDYRGPLYIELQPDIAYGFPCLRAKDLLVQGHDPEGHLWATRGMVAYRLSEGDAKFIRQYHIPTGFSIFWLRNFSIVRRLTLRPECVELLSMPNGEACAMSAGHMWYSPGYGGGFEETLTLSHYGIGIGQGIRNDGLVRLNNGTILFGEYFMNRNRTNVKIYASRDNGRTWQVAYNFGRNQIRHVHAVQQDPYTEKAWICTGDRDKDSTVSWTTDDGETFHPIGQGSQLWRVCQLVFTKEALFWGTDTGNSSVSGIYKWDRRTHEITKLIDIPGVVMYGTRLADGTIIVSLSCVGVENEKDDKTRLWIITNGKKVTSIVCGTRGSQRKLAKLRFQRDQGGTSLYMTCLNHKEFSDGDLIIISEKALKAATSRQVGS
jgi:hypothetical protein